MQTGRCVFTGSIRCSLSYDPRYWYLCKCPQLLCMLWCMFVHGNSEGYMQIWFMSTEGSCTALRGWRLAEWLSGCFVRSFLLPVSIRQPEQQALLWSHYGPWFPLPLLIDTPVISPQQEPVHALTIATIHLNQLKKEQRAFVFIS